MNFPSYSGEWELVNIDMIQAANPNTPTINFVSLGQGSQITSMTHISTGIKLTTIVPMNGAKLVYIGPPNSNHGSLQSLNGVVSGNTIVFPQPMSGSSGLGNLVIW